MNSRIVVIPLFLLSAGAVVAEPPLSGSVPLKLDVYEKVSKPEGGWPVTDGVPFVEGGLKSADHVRLVSPGVTETPTCPIN